MRALRFGALVVNWHWRLLCRKKTTNEEEKQPIDMTSDELLDYAIAPEVAERVKRIAKPQDEPTATLRSGLNMLNSTSMIREYHAADPVSSR